MRRSGRRQALIAVSVLAVLVTAVTVLVLRQGSAGTATRTSHKAPASAAVLSPRARTAYRMGPATDISASCPGSNAEVEQAVDAHSGYVYQAWIGCGGIAFARSADRGRTFSRPVSISGSPSSHAGVWDPALAVAPDGTVYAAYMRAKSGQQYPVVAASFDHGATFPQVAALIPPATANWGDRDFIAVSPTGTVYVTWDYGPDRKSVKLNCPSGGSCALIAGDLNTVMQKSADHGRTWGPITHVSPGFPASGGDSAPLLVSPGGQIDVLYQEAQPGRTAAGALSPGYEYFTSSTDGGRTWSAPVQVGPRAGTMSDTAWWIDGDIAADAAGNLYATWDTQGTGSAGHVADTGWLSYSTDRGAHWSVPVQAPPDQLGVPHIMEVAGGGPGTAYVGWLSDSSPRGYTLYLRAFSIGRGWLSAPVQVPAPFGNRSIWPGDTFGISAIAANQIVLSWGSAPRWAGKRSQIFATTVGVRSG